MKTDTSLAAEQLACMGKLDENLGHTLPRLSLAVQMRGPTCPTCMKVLNETFRKTFFWCVVPGLIAQQAT